ncbi:MAG: hypothetical protein P8J50_12040 [Acidimicrobiales bacterium]|jgi:hypothetical protein|nr:hypothetical protein [Acidimicrobiales bacterium]
MRNRDHRQELNQPFEPFGDLDWPDPQLDVDDEAFARAIAEGRGEELAA